ncbi:AAA family ATPase [Sphingorhabdus sp.]|uniref:AAA family ATPase n=1 Tax=Sphingorhabdus sp. TaxID=1902408 RepID=UPI0032B71335
MFIKSFKLKNWRNFREVDVPVGDTTYILGANASGKSNLLDVFRFLRDICKTEGGGLQKAIAQRRGLSKLRCLHARTDPEVAIEITLEDSDGIDWRYALAFKSEGKGAQRVLISKEEVWRKKKLLRQRPDKEDKKDVARLTQTHLEQIQTNEPFREIAEFFSDINYLHLVPQLLKFGDEIGGRRLEDDPFGQGFLERLARTTTRVRDSRLRKIRDALQKAVPQFEELDFEKDDITGRPHLKALYKHHRPRGAWQREDQFSDGTLRLIGLLWSLLEGDSLLLIEEPELSLNPAIVAEIPLMIQQVRKSAKRRRQVFVTTHSESLLSNPGIDANSVLIIEPGPNGSTIRGPSVREKQSVEDGFSIAEIILPVTKPKLAEQLALAL